MKKYLALIAILALGITFMAACGSKNEETTLPTEEEITNITDQYNTDNQTTDQTTTIPTDKTSTETPTEGENKDMGTTNTNLGKTVVFETNYGAFEISLYADAPIASKKSHRQSKFRLLQRTHIPSRCQWICHPGWRSTREWHRRWHNGS